MQMFFGSTCVVCRSEGLIFRKKQSVLGITLHGSFLCENCGSVFMQDELKWKLVGMKDKFNPLWQQFRQKSFYVREWINIAGAQECCQAAHLV